MAQESKILVSEPGIDDESLRRRAADLGLEWFESVPDAMLVPDLVADIPVEWARANCLLPVRTPAGILLLMADPAAQERLEEVELLLRCEARPAVASRKVVAAAIERCYYLRHNSAAAFMRGMDDGAPAVEGVGRRRHSEDLLQEAQEAPITNLVNLILLEAVKARATDIHFEPFEAHLRVRYRIDGILYDQPAPPKHLEQPLVSRLKIMAHMDIAEKRLPQDGMAKVSVGERAIDIRLSTIPVAEGERVVLRLLNRASSCLPLSDLGMPPPVYAALDRQLQQPNGLIIVSGPTGSGKTTTLYAALGRIDSARRNVLTIEDPIEYQIPNIGQMQVHPKIGLTFAVGLRHILRQDPDVVLVGETRDQETAEIAVRASLTGHLVFTTLHTNDAASAIIRMMDIGIEPYLLAAAVRGVLAQRLVRRLCQSCRRKDVPDAGILGRLGPDAGILRGGAAWTPHGCDACRDGYHGRIGIFEMITVDETIQDLVWRGGGTVRALRDAARAQQMPSLLQDGLTKVRDGVTSLDEILYVLGRGS